MGLITISSIPVCDLPRAPASAFESRTRYHLLQFALRLLVDIGFDQPTCPLLERGQLTIGFARTEAADRPGRPAAQPNRPFFRPIETVQMSTPARSRVPLGCRQDPLPSLLLSAAYPR